LPEQAKILPKLIGVIPAWANFEAILYVNSQTNMKRHLKSFCLSFLALSFFSAPIFAQKKESAQEWVKRGNEAKEEHLKIIYYSEAIRIAPSEPQPYLWRGMAKRTVGKHIEAIADFDSALARRPDYELALAMRGDAYLRLKKYESAENDLNKALRLNSDNDFALSRLGELAKQKGKLTQAKVHWKAAFGKNPRNEYATERLAVAYADESKLDSAIFFVEPDHTVKPAQRQGLDGSRNSLPP
jgi:Putative Zn-dependent protease, contains TPR repeats